LLSSGSRNANDGNFIGVGDVAAIEADAQQILAGAGHFTGIRGYFNSAAAKTVTFTLRINAVDTTLSCSITTVAKTCSTTGASIAFSDGDLITIRVNTTIGGQPASAALTVGP
jgi:hypothetical protein